MEIIEFELVGANIVVLAETFNPSIASKEWLSQKGVIKEGVTGFIHTPVTSIVETPTISIFVDLIKLQLTLSTPRKSQMQKLVSTAKAYVEALPETPYRAVGLNIAFSLKDRTRLSEEYLPRREPLEKLFGTLPDRGAVFTFPHSVFRVTLVLRPIGDGGLNASFNFHRDIKGSEDLLSTIRHHSDCYDVAERLLGGMLIE